MSNTVIHIENVSKLYKLGLVSTRSLAHDVNRWWHLVRGKEDPYLKVGQPNARDSKKSSDYIYALNDINMAVQEGEVLGIVGKNGAGKSTLLKILSRITSPSTGIVRIRGRVASLLEVGTGFHPELTGRENIFLNGAIQGLSTLEISSRLDEIIDFSGCSLYIDTPVKRYSSGMYVRLAFAVAAHLEPEILIVDEVLAVGDAAFQRKCLAKMDDIAACGRTVIMVSHQMASIESLCSRCLVISEGKVVYDATAREAVDYYYSNIAYPSMESEIVLTNSHRSGTGLMRITSMKVLNENGDEVKYVTPGSTVVFRLEYEVYDASYPMREVDVGLSLHLPRTDMTLAVVYSSYYNQYYTVDGKYGAFNLTVPVFPLAPGRYRVGGRLLVGGIEADWPRMGVGFVDVVDGDYYGTGRRTKEGQALLYIDGVWN